MVKRKRKIENRYKFDRFFIHVLLFLVVPVLKGIFGIKKSEKMSLPEGGCMVLYNHVTDLDVVWIIDAFRTHMYCVASEHIVRFPVAGKLIRYFFAPILIKKSTGGAGAVMEMHRHIKAGHNILLAPEGVRTGNGRTGAISPVIASVIKKLKCPVVTVRIHGGFMTTPRWGRGIRRGQMTVEKVSQYSKEEISAMSADDLHARICDDLAEDAYSNPVAHKGRRRAENIELQLYLCPSCRQYFTIRSEKNDFFCSCGLHGTVNEYGELSGDKIPYRTIGEWDGWEKNYIKDYPLPKKESAEEVTLLQSVGPAIRSIDKEHGNALLDRGNLVLTNLALSVGDTKIPIGEIAEVSIISYGILLIATKEGQYFEIKGKQKYPGEAYMNFIHKLKS